MIAEMLTAENHTVGAIHGSMEEEERNKQALTQRRKKRQDRKRRRRLNRECLQDGLVEAMLEDSVPRNPTSSQRHTPHDASMDDTRDEKDLCPSANDNSHCADVFDAIMHTQTLADIFENAEVPRISTQI